MFLLNPSQGFLFSASQRGRSQQGSGRLPWLRIQVLLGPVGEPLFRFVTCCILVCGDIRWFLLPDDPKRFQLLEGNDVIFILWGRRIFSFPLFIFTPEMHSGWASFKNLLGISAAVHSP